MTFSSRLLRFLLWSTCWASGPLALAQSDDTPDITALPLPSLDRPAVVLTALTRNDKVAATTVELAHDGQALLPIVISSTATADVRAAAADAARVLSQITGGEFVVQVGDGTAGLVLGTLTEFPHPELATALRINNSYEGREAYAIRTSPGRVLILGATSLGVTDGLYRLLHELGCRWLVPTPTWEVLPEPQATLRWNRDITDRPRILARAIVYKTGFDYEKEQTAYGTTPTQDRETWGRRNAHLDGLGINAGHAYGGIRRRFKAEFSAHPEYWPLVDGKRLIDFKRADYGQLDLGNPAVRKLLLEHARAYFRAKPEATMISLEPNDGGGWSQSPEFKALGSISDAVFGMANEVARMLQREFPGKMVGLYAYREHAEPPSFRLEPNVYVQITSQLSSKRTPQEVIRLWSEQHSNLGFYDYYAPYAWHLDAVPGANASSFTYLTTRIRAEAAGPATSITAEASGGWALFALGYYVATRLMWDPTLNPEALRTDFLTNAFGPAAPAMERYYARWAPDNRPLVTKELLYAMCQDLRAAQTAAAKRPDVLARLHDLQQYVRYLELDWRVRAMPTAQPYAEREAAFIALMRHAYRIRYTYMIHWGLASQNLWQHRAEAMGVVEVKKGPPRTKKVVNPRLLTATNFPENPWRDPAPFTSAEIARDFAATEAYFKTPPVQTISFSTDLVAVDWSGRVPPGGLLATRPVTVSVQGGTTHLMLTSAQGEPLRVTVRPGNNQARRTHPRPWTLTDATGKQLAAGRVIASDSNPDVILSLAVPAAGTYDFAITDNNGFLDISVTDPVPVALRLIPGEKINHNLRKQGWFFYVPKGTREVVMYFDAWAPAFTLTGPDGSVRYSNASTNHPTTLLHVPVPANSAGGIWRFDAVRIGPLCLLNVPPYLSPSPDRLLVPREVATRDGLVRRPGKR